MPAEIVFLRREKVLVDTSVYIGHLNRDLYSDLILNLIRTSVLYLHSIVFEELLAGARTDKEIRELHWLKKPFSGAGRIVTPSDEDWEETGLLVNRLVGKASIPPSKAVSLTHDILLAVSARKMGARVITENQKDFEKIRSLKDFKLTVWTTPL